MKTMALVLTTLLLGACAGMGGEMQIADSWHGAKAGELVAAWGEPAQTVNLSDGRKVLQWGAEPVSVNQPVSQALGSAYGLGAPGTVQGTAVPYESLSNLGSCVRSYIIAPTGEVLSGNARGSTCCAEVRGQYCMGLLKHAAATPAQ